jgi:hypothetical protein
MPHIAGLFEYRPETAWPLQQLAEVLVERVHADVDGAPVSAKLKALLQIAAAVQRDGKAVTPEDPEAYAKLAERIVAQGYLRP